MITYADLANLSENIIRFLDRRLPSRRERIATAFASAVIASGPDTDYRRFEVLSCIALADEFIATLDGSTP